MIFETTLIKGKLIKRYKRFLADVELEDGSITTAHCPNSGAMQGLTEPETPVWLSKSNNPNRKLPYTWEMAEANGTFVGMNTSNPNDLVEEAIKNNVIKELESFQNLRREVSYGKNSRIDILLEHADQSLSYIEVKNVHLKRGDTAAFPSSVTTRGSKHMRELSEMVQQGHNAFVIFVVQRNDCHSFEIAKDIDPTYDQEVKKAMQTGVHFLVYACEVTPKAITITHQIKF